MGEGPYRNPAPTVDIIIEVAGGKVLLIERKNPPHGWALPGGFVDYGETLAAAARPRSRREAARRLPCRRAASGAAGARDETDLEVELVELFHCYSDPARDPRGHTVSTVFIARSGGTARAGDDAGEVAAFALDALPALAFDHATILADFGAYRASGRRPPPER